MTLAFPKQVRKKGRTFRRYPALTEAAAFLDVYSYISFRIHPGTNHHCQYLKGKDVQPMREKIYERDNHRCVLKIVCDGTKEWPFEGKWWERWHLEHEKGGEGADRCWCEENLRGSCPGCNAAKHNREPRWSRKG